MAELTQLGTVKDPVCGMQVAPENAASIVHDGKTVFLLQSFLRRKISRRPEALYTIGNRSRLRHEGCSRPGSRRIEKNGKTYFFCGKSCAEKFQNAPVAAETQAGDAAASSPPSKAEVEYVCPMDPEVHESQPGPCPICGMALEPAQYSLTTEVVEYTCPMHPQIVLPEPQNCPICGMALEPRVVSVKDANPELEDMTRRFAVAAVLTIPLIVRMVLSLLSDERFDTILTSPFVEWMQLILASMVVLWCGWPFLERAWKSIETHAPEHVYADRPGCRRQLWLQRCPIVLIAPADARPAR